MKRWMTALAVVPFLVAATVAVAPRPFVRDVAHSQINFVAESQLVDAHGTLRRASTRSPRAASTSPAT